MEIDLTKIAYDPVAVQGMIVDEVANESGFDILDPTNSFTLLLEANTATTVSVYNEIIGYERRIFPSLANTEEDLHNHMVEFDEKNFFASPADTSVKLKISVESILKYGVTNESHLYKLTIPKNSVIDIDGLDLTIMNDISVSLNTQGSRYRTFGENIINDESFIFKNSGNIVSIIEVDDKNVPWVVMNIDVLQVSHIAVNNVVTRGLGFDIEIPVNDLYYVSRVTFTNISGVVEEIPKVFTDTRFDPDKLSIYVKVLNGKVQYKIPKVYIDRGFVSGTVNIDIYTTRGKIQIPLNNYDSNEYGFRISRDTPTVDKAASIKANYNISSKSVINGGSNIRQLRDMKTRIIHRATGNIDIPITEKQLSEFSRIYGFTLSKAVDTITERIFIASKDSYDNNLNVPAPIDTINNTVKIEYTDGVNLEKISIEPNLTIIKPNTLFIDNNGVIKPVPDTENIINGLSSKKRIEYLNENKMLYNPFLYIIDNNISTTTARVYDIENASMDSVVIDSKNKYLKENANVSGYNIFQVDDGYDIFIQIIGNSDYQAIKDNVKVQLKLSSVSGSNIYYHSVISEEKTKSRFGDDEEPLHYIHIDSTFSIDVDDNITLSGGESASAYNPIDIHTVGEIVIYYPDSTIATAGEVQTDALNYNAEENITISGGLLSPIGMSKEHINISFADNLKYLWRRVFISYNNRKYKRYTQDVPLLYTHNIYDNDTNCGVVITQDANGDCDTVTVPVLHAKGSPVLDENGIPIIKYKAGDIMLDEDNNPIFDKEEGIDKMVDIFMMEYEYKISTKNNYVTHLNNTIDLVRDWVLNKLVDMNKVVLEQTKIIYMASKSNSQISTGGKVSSNIIRPSVRLYITPHSSGETVEGSRIYNDIGKILHRFFSKKYIVISDLEDAIMREYPILAAVKVYDYLDNDPKIINIEDTRIRFSLNKKVDSDFEIIYDYNLEII